MPILKNMIIAAALLASTITAAPLAAIDARAVVLTIKTETSWVTIGRTATVWINDADPTTPTAITITATETSSTTSITLITSITTPTPPPSPSPSLSPSLSLSSSSPLSLSPAPSSSPSPAPAPVSESAAPVPEPVTSTSQVAAPAVSPAGFVAAVEPTTSQAPAPAPTTSTAAAPPPAASTSAASIPAVTSKDITASTSATCEGKDNACVGDVTHWDGGLGACGWNVDTNSDFSIALPVGFMGAQSNGNPYCGRSLTIYNPTTGNTVQATVGDKCMGCVDRAIDLTNALFDAIVPGGDGRVKGIEWWFN